jgi:DNA-binding LacI/PurR family transcriptional regulator
VKLLASNLARVLKYALTGVIATLVPLYAIVTGAAYFGTPILQGTGILGIILLILISTVVGLGYTVYKMSLLESSPQTEEVADLREELGKQIEQTRELREKNQSLEEEAELLRHQKELPWKIKNSIGVVAPIAKFPTSYFLDTIRAIRSAMKNGTHLVLFDLNKEQTDEVKVFFKTKKFINLVDGLITISVDISPTDMKALAKLKFPVVNIFNNVTDPPIIGNINPRFDGFRDLMEHLADMHHSQHFYLVSRPLVNPLKFSKIDPFRKARRDIFYEVLQKYRIPINASEDIWHAESLLDSFDGSRSAVIETREYTLEAGRALFESMAHKLREDSAIVCLADTVAAGFLLAAAEDNFDITGLKLRITGFDNSYIASFYDISSVDYNLPLTGELAYRRLQVAISNLERGGNLLSAIEDPVITKFVPRSSCCLDGKRGERGKRDARKRALNA